MLTCSINAMSYLTYMTASTREVTITIVRKYFLNCNPHQFTKPCVPCAYYLILNPVQHMVTRYCNINLLISRLRCFIGSCLSIDKQSYEGEGVTRDWVLRIEKVLELRNVKSCFPHPSNHVSNVSSSLKRQSKRNLRTDFGPKKFSFVIFSYSVNRKRYSIGLCNRV